MYSDQNRIKYARAYILKKSCLVSKPYAVILLISELNMQNIIIIIMLCRRYDDNNWVRRRRLRYCVLLDKKKYKNSARDRYLGIFQSRCFSSARFAVQVSPTFRNRSLILLLLFFFCCCSNHLKHTDGYAYILFPKYSKTQSRQLYLGFI